MLDKMIAGLLAQAGLTPQHLVSAYQTVMTWNAEKDNFKLASAQAMQHFNSRLDRLESMLVQLDATLAALESQNVSQPLNGPKGAIEHERKQQ